MFELTVAEKCGFFKTEITNSIFDHDFMMLGNIRCTYDAVIRMLITGTDPVEIDIALSEESFSAKLHACTFSPQNIQELRRKLGDRLIVK